MIESGPVKITFDAKQKVTGLKVITSLDAANQLGKAAIEIVAWIFRLPLVHAPPKLPPT